MFQVNPLPNRGFTWNIKSYSLWKTMKKYLWMSSAAWFKAPQVELVEFVKSVDSNQAAPVLAHLSSGSTVFAL